MSKLSIRELILSIRKILAKKVSSVISAISSRKATNNDETKNNMLNVKDSINSVLTKKTTTVPTQGLQKYKTTLTQDKKDKL